MIRHSQTRSPKKNRRNFGSQSARHRKLRAEHLESRQMLTLLGVSSLLGFPRINYAGPGQLTYDAGTNAFNVTAVPSAFRLNASSAPVPITNAAGTTPSLELHIRVDNSGNLIGGVVGDDFIVRGDIDVDSDSVVDFSGTLITGEILEFGFQDIASTDQYDYRLQFTGGALASFFVDGGIGVTTNSENSSFNGSFASDFRGNANGNVAPTPLVSSLSGFVYSDTDNDGVFDLPEDPIPGVQINLSGTDFLGAPVNLVDFTDGTGKYEFLDLLPGTYMITEVQPPGFLDGKDTIGTPGGSTGNDVFSLINLGANVNGVNNNFGELVPASLSGFVYVDVDNDGAFDLSEVPVAGATVTLTGTNDLGAVGPIVAFTDIDGAYVFANLRPGTYTLTETTPAGLIDGKDTQGTPGTGAPSNDQFSNITLPVGFVGLENNFGERGLIPDLINKSYFLASSPPIEAFFVDGIMQVVVNRSATSNEIVNAVTTFALGGTRADFARSVITGDENRSQDIDALYREYLGRAADPAGLAYWLGVWEAHGGREEVQAGIIGSPEYYQTAGGTDAAWVNALYNTILDRNAGQVEIDYWVGQMQNHDLRDIVLGFVTSDEYRLNNINQWYQDFLGRSVDEAGGQYWLNQLKSGKLTQEDIQVLLAGSLEGLLRWS